MYKYFWTQPYTEEYEIYLEMQCMQSMQKRQRAEEKYVWISDRLWQIPNIMYFTIYILLEVLPEV